MKLFPFLSLLFSSILASPLTAPCSRESLKSTLNNFFSTAISKPANSEIAVKTATVVKIAQNNQILKSVGETAWTNITSFYKPWRVDAIDPEICTIASFVLVNEKNAQGIEPGLVSIRIKTDSNSAIKELEILNVLKGSHALFSPDAFPDKAPEMWSSLQKGNISREDLIKLANEYPSAIANGDGSKIAGGSTCPRIENGVQTTEKCYEGLQKVKQPVINRRWVADTLTGVVLGEFYFDKQHATGNMYRADRGLWLNEYFKIDDGKMVGILACMKEFFGKQFDDVWQT